MPAAWKKFCFSVEGCHFRVQENLELFMCAKLTYPCDGFKIQYISLKIFPSDGWVNLSNTIYLICSFRYPLFAPTVIFIFILVKMYTGNRIPTCSNMWPSSVVPSCDLCQLWPVPPTANIWPPLALAFNFRLQLQLLHFYYFILLFLFFYSDKCYLQI